VIEIPEAFVLANQIDESLSGKIVDGVEVPANPGKFSFYLGDPLEYERTLNGSDLSSARAIGGMVEISIDKRRLVFSDGAVPRFYEKNETPQPKSQLTVRFGDGSFLSVYVRLYAGLWCFEEGDFDNKYYLAAQEKPSPLSDNFDENYFSKLFDFEKADSLSLKGFLATEQRIPGLGNGVLQDIAWTAGLHPRIKISKFSDADKERLFSSIKTVLRDMTENCGRDSEKDLFGIEGKYKTVIGRATFGKPCPRCGETIERQNYLGGKVYFCPSCQRME
jgi:formamidopyrimidine-DNA glycosylase